MSYARMGADGSNVYIYMSVGDRDHPGGWLECCWCSLEPHCYRAFSTNVMIRHLQRHISLGDHVPERVIPELQADDAENFTAKPT